MLPHLLPLWEKVARSAGRGVSIHTYKCLRKQTPHPSELVSASGDALSHKGRGHSNLHRDLQPVGWVEPLRNPSHLFLEVSSPSALPRHLQSDDSRDDGEPE